jgi:hypothetical protein
MSSTSTLPASMIRTQQYNREFIYRSKRQIRVKSLSRYHNNAIDISLI